MIIGDGASADALHMLLPREREAARDEAVRLARRFEFLAWPERAKLLDDFLWDQAKSRLDNERVTAVINRQGHGGGNSAVVGAYARYCRAVVTSALLELAEPGRATDGDVAVLAYRFSLLGEHQEVVAAGWTDDARRDRIAGTLAGLPGHAFLLLAMSPSDTADSFLARDAFFAAMLGQG